MTIYYHVSTDIFHKGEMIPRVPSHRHQQEDAKIPRICVAPTIEDCLTAIPGGGSDLEELNLQQRGYYLVFKIDTEKLGISDKHIITSEELYQKDWVRDADVTNEVWITTSFKVPEEDQFIIRLLSWEEVAHDVLPYSIYDIADREYEGDYLQAYMEVYQEEVPCCVGIMDAQYIHEKSPKGTEISLYFEDEKEKEWLKRFVKEHYDMEMKKEWTDEMTFQLNTDANLRPLFLYHRKVINI